MEIRKKAELYVLYPEAQEGILYDSPELLLMKYISENNMDAAMALFRDKRQFSDAPPAVDTPYGRFGGKEQICTFAKGFITRFEADGLDIVPKFQTRSGGRSVTEMVLNFEVSGMIDQVRGNEHRDLVDHAVDLKVQHHFRHGSSAAPGLELRNDLQPVCFKPGDEAFREGMNPVLPVKSSVGGVHCRRSIRKLPPVRKQRRRAGRIVLRDELHHQKLGRII